VLLAVKILGLLVYIATLLVGWLLTVVGLPGNWLIVAAAAVFAFIGPSDGRWAISWQVVAALVILATLAELIELAAGALGVSRAGGSRRAAALALVGSIVGAVVGAIVGLPVPIVGQLVAVVLFSAIGAFAGAWLGETWKGRDSDQGLQVGQAAFWSRLVAAVVKLSIGSAMVAIGLAALLI
jgi:uncharacterized protein